MVVHVLGNKHSNISSWSHISYNYNPWNYLTLVTFIKELPFTILSCVDYLYNSNYPLSLFLGLPNLSSICWLPTWRMRHLAYFYYCSSFSFLVIFLIFENTLIFLFLFLVLFFIMFVALNNVLKHRSISAELIMGQKQARVFSKELRKERLSYSAQFLLLVLPSR